LGWHQLVLLKFTADIMTATAQNEISLDPSLLFARNSDIPSTGEELRAAIASLKASTRATECRTRVLRRQSTLSDRLKLFSNSSRNGMAGNARYFAQKEIAEVQHVKFAVCPLLACRRLLV
jgi:hypothetical protein